MGVVGADRAPWRRQRSDSSGGAWNVLHIKSLGAGRGSSLPNALAPRANRSHHTLFSCSPPSLKPFVASSRRRWALLSNFEMPCAVAARSAIFGFGGCILRVRKKKNQKCNLSGSRSPGDANEQIRCPRALGGRAPCHSEGKKGSFSVLARTSADTGVNNDGWGVGTLERGRGGSRMPLVSNSARRAAPSTSNSSSWVVFMTPHLNPCLISAA